MSAPMPTIPRNASGDIEATAEQREALRRHIAERHGWEFGPRASVEAMQRWADACQRRRYRALTEREMTEFKDLVTL